MRNVSAADQSHRGHVLRIHFLFLILNESTALLLKSKPAMLPVDKCSKMWYGDGFGSFHSPIKTLISLDRWGFRVKLIYINIFFEP